MGHYNKYRVEFDDFTERHFGKKFEKKYRGRWRETKDDIVRFCERIEKTINTDRMKLIDTQGKYRLVKMYFTVLGTRLSPKAAGNRCILVVDDEKKLVRVLLVYSKGDLRGAGETVGWKMMIREQFPEVGERFRL